MMPWEVKISKGEKMLKTIRNMEGPINDLFYAINFYISTGDHIGEGNAAEMEDGQLFVIIPINFETVGTQCATVAIWIFRPEL